MRYIYFLLPVFIGVLASCESESSTEEEKVPNTVRGNVEETRVLPAFKGGDTAFVEFLGLHMFIPDSAVFYGVDADVDVELAMDSTGRVESVLARQTRLSHPHLDNDVVLNARISYNYLFSKEAERLMWLTENLWNPGEQLNEAVATTHVVTLHFRTKQHSDALAPAGAYFVPRKRRHDVLFYESGTSLLTQTRYGYANSFFDAATRLNPIYRDAWFNRGIALKQMNQMSDACRCWTQAARLGDQEALGLIADICGVKRK